MRQAQTGSLRSTPKQLKLTGSDKTDAVFKNMGNNHNVPLSWSASATVASGTTEVVLASGIKFYDMDLASYATVTAMPTSNPGGNFWVDKDESTNILKLVVSSAVSNDVDFDLRFSLGSGIDLNTFTTRGTGAPAQSYP